MNHAEQLRARLNPHSQNLVDVMADGFMIQRNWLKLFQPMGWSTRTCWLVLVPTAISLTLLCWMLMEMLIRI